MSNNRASKFLAVFRKPRKATSSLSDQRMTYKQLYYFRKSYVAANHRDIDHTVALLDELKEVDQVLHHRPFTPEEQQYRNQLTAQIRANIKDLFVRVEESNRQYAQLVVMSMEIQKRSQKQSLPAPLKRVKTLVSWSKKLRSKLLRKN